MTARTTLNLHFDAEDVRADFKPGTGEERGYAVLDIGAYGDCAVAHLHPRDTAAVDAAIRELAALKTDMLAAQAIAGDFGPEITDGGAK